MSAATQRSIAGARNRRRGADDSDLHGGVRRAAVSDRPVRAVSDVRADGADGAGLGLGLRTLRNRIVASVSGLNGVVFGARGGSRGINLQLVPVVSELRAGPTLASGGYGFRLVDRARDLDLIQDSATELRLEQMIWAPNYLIPKASGLAVAVSGFFLLLFEDVGWLKSFAGSLGAGLFAFLAVLAKIRYDKWRERARADNRINITGAHTAIEREKLIDARFAQLITEMQEFHAEQIKGMQQSVLLARELYEQEKALVAEKNTLIAQQAGLIEQLRR